jgi:similar to spore coat protein
MAGQGLAVHETLELHELLVFKTTCLTKSSTMQALATDQDLKALLQQDVQTSSKSVQELQNLLSRASI